LARDAEAGAGVSLGIEVDNQDLLPDRGKRGCQIDGRRRFSDPAFLIGDGEGPG
jgi:hypothetical protein